MSDIKPFYGPWPKIKTDEEIRELAKQLYRGEIYTSDQTPPDLTSMVWMVMAFAGEEHIESMRRDGIAMFYEEISKAGPRAINGHPCFFSMAMLNFVDRERLYDAYDDILRSLGEHPDQKRKVVSVRVEKVER